MSTHSCISVTASGNHFFPRLVMTWIIWFKENTRCEENKLDSLFEVPEQAEHAIYSRITRKTKDLTKGGEQKQFSSRPKTFL